MMKNILVKLSIIAMLSTSLFANVGELIFKGAVEVVFPIIMDMTFKSDTQKSVDRTNTEKSMENFKNFFRAEKEPKKVVPGTPSKDIGEGDPCIF